MNATRLDVLGGKLDWYWQNFLLIWAGAVALYFFGAQQLTRSRLIKIAESQVASLERFIRTTPYSDTPRFSLLRGEKVVYEVDGATLAEARRGARVTRRNTDAFTFRFAPGFYYTAAGGTSVSEEPIDEMKEIDHGRATFTTHRVIFSGATQTREWLFSKMLGWQSGAGGYIFMSVQNRQKVSGVRTGAREVMGFVLFQLAQIAANDGIAAAQESAKQGIYMAKAQGQFMRENFLATETKLGRFVEELENRLDEHLKKMDELEVEIWVEPGSEFPTKSGSQSKPVPPKTKSSSKGARNEAQNQLPTEINVVGEYFHQDSFLKLAEVFDVAGGAERFVDAELRVDPDNEFSSSGQAVAVSIEGLPVGHIPDHLAPLLVGKLEERDGRIIVNARVWFDFPNSNPPKNSVKIFRGTQLS